MGTTASEVNTEVKAMAKFAGKAKRTRERINNYAGGEGFLLNDESTLLNLVSTCMMNEPKFYGEPGEVEEKIFDLARKVDPKFLLQLAVYTRTELNLRSVPMFLLAIAANREDGKPFVREYAKRIIQRADELYESLACYIEYFGKPVPNSLKKGVADSFANFDEYQLAKYDRNTGLTLKDVMCLVHPKEPREPIQKIHDRTLQVPITWETEISSKGNMPEVWESLIDQGKLPYMAMLRNLRNLLYTDDKGISRAHLDSVISSIRNPEAVRNSRQLPFRFLSAYREVQLAYAEPEERVHWKNPRTAEVLDALDDAVSISTENIPKMKGTTFLVSDVSGSMMGRGISERSQVRPGEIALLMTSAAHKFTENAYVGVFGEKFKTMSLPKRSSGIISNLPRMFTEASTVGHSSNGHLAIRYLNSTETFVDRILIFSDMQLWDSDQHPMLKEISRSINDEYGKYRKNINPDVRMYMFNLNGYGTVTIPEKDRSVMNINGWSDRVLKFIQASEADPDTQVKYIKENY